MDGALLVPQEWFPEPQGCRKGAIPEGRVHRTKPELALPMLEGALEVGGQA